MGYPILPYDASFCGCCNCSIGWLDVVVKGGDYLRVGYPEFAGPAKLFRSIISRGWGGDGSGADLLDNPVKNNVLCSFGRSFEVPAVAMPRYGSTDSKLWTGAYPWGNGPLVNLPVAESLDCDDGFFDFVSDSYSAQSHQAPPLTNQLDFIVGPRGYTAVFNEITEDAAFDELLEYVEALSWPSTYELCWNALNPLVPCAPHLIAVKFAKAASGYMHYSRAKYRVRFPPPKNGTGYRLEWDLYFTPEAGERTLYDTLSWEWDRVLPGGFDPEDPDTFPATPFFETPLFEGDYGVFDIAPGDWRALCGPEEPVGTPGAVTGRAV